MSTAATWGDDDMLEFPHKLPTEFEYKQKFFYVRECFPSIYEEVLFWLKAGWKIHVVAVTGARGVGKSVFYAYFFLRYSVEFPLATVITASFTEASKLTKVVVWRSGAVIDEAEGNVVQMIRTIRRARKQAKHGAIYLFDGRQPDLIRLDADTVCFARPKDKWLAAFDRSPHHFKLMMPLWDLEELQHAAALLDLVMQDSGKVTVDRDGKVRILEDACIEERFSMFGGVARECLSTDAAYVNARKRLMEETIANLTEEALKRAARCPDPNLAQYGISHYAPKSYPKYRHRIEEASPFVRELFGARLKELDEKKRQAKFCLIL